VNTEHRCILIPDQSVYLIFDRPWQVISWENTLSTYEEKSISATFVVQLNDLEHQSPDASNLLKILSFFDPENIPLDMITQGAETLSRSLASSTTTSSDRVASGNILSSLHRILLRRTKPKRLETMDRVDHPELKSLLHLILSPVQLQNAITQLKNRSLVKHTRSADISVLRIHDLIRIMVQTSLTNSGADREWFKIAVELACGAFQLVEDPGSYKCWSRCAILAPHFQLLTMQDETYGSRSIPIMEANWKIAIYLESSGRYGEAEALYERTLAVSEKQLGLEHRDTLTIMHNLAMVHYSRGRHSEAEKEYKHVLVLQEKHLGLEHPDTLRTMHNLAIVYSSQGRYSEAEKQYKHVLTLREKQLGLEHPDTLTTMHNLANVYYSQGRHSEAETQYKHVLRLREKLLGLEHPDTLGTMHGLAIVYDSPGRQSEAETQFKHVLALTEKQLGVEHPDTLRIMDNLAWLYQSLDRHSEAAALREQVEVIKERKRAKEHSDLSHSVNS
jgi:tetratricopeptide (TPR) repeat protein